MHKLILIINLFKLRKNLTIFEYLNFKLLKRKGFSLFFNYSKGFNLNYYNGIVLKKKFSNLKPNLQ